MVNILIAPNSFKNSLTAEEVADAIAQGIQNSGIKAKVLMHPIADGGDHTSFLLTKLQNGAMHTAKVKGAYLKPTQASYGLINNGKTAIIEVAETSGFKSIKQKLKSPLESSTKGLGELINICIKSGITDFIICLGGSVTVDGGIGMLQELGLEFFDGNKKLVRPLPKDFDKVDAMDRGKLKEQTSKCKFTVLCDVNNPLLGKEGAAHVFGPQKGASADDIRILEEFLQNFESLTFDSSKKSLNKVLGGGAAGGLAAAFSVFLNADLKKGAEYFCEITDFEKSLQKADILITGEGSMDSQSLEGKAPITVAKLAIQKKIPCIAIAGKIPLEIPDELQQYFTMLMPIGNQPEEIKEAMANTKNNIVRTIEQISKLIHFFHNKGQNKD
ncbi:glycerate kinase [Sphingobacterium sp. 1.A.5]|uniref:glycerate kinase family protein n=1 Tax=Sphingobacterium sp. 1.A.5 TaxID=2044604 RepID=UPI000C0BE6BA|nr:glycerate kinase [Sphingobacterium sp. 1.A.5]